MTIEASNGGDIMRVGTPAPTGLYGIASANPTGVVFLSGDSVTEGSVRQIFDGQFLSLQKLLHGQWVNLDKSDEFGSTIVKSVKTGVGSVHLGDVHSMASAGENVVFKNEASLVAWFPVWQGGSMDGSTVFPPASRLYLSGIQVMGNGTANSAGNTTIINHTTTENHNIYTVTVVPAETWSGQATFFGNFGNKNILTVDEVISAVADVPLTVVLTYPVDVRVGNMINAFIQKQDGTNTNLSLRPSVQDPGNPWYQINYKAFTDLGVASSRDEKTQAPIQSPSIYQSASAPYIAQFGTSLYPNWAYQLPITINNPVANGVLSNFVVTLTINTAYPISAGRMQSSGNGIRFVDSTGTIPLSYDLVSGINTFTTTILVTTTLAVGNNTIYMLYGNPSASSASTTLTAGVPANALSITYGMEDVWLPSSITQNVAITATGVQANGSQYQRFISTWNASTNTPAIPAASAANQGNYYVTSVAGTTSVGTNNLWGIGDWLVSNGTSWDRLPQQITPVLTAIDYNTLTLKGVYVGNTAPSANYPDGATFPWNMMVITEAGITLQLLTTLHDTFQRSYNGTSWTAWGQRLRDTPYSVINYLAAASPIAAVPGLTTVDCTAGAGTVTLPTITALLNGKHFVFKKIDSANSNTLTINGPIDGGTSLAWHTPFQSFTLVADFNSNMYWIT